MEVGDCCLCLIGELHFGNLVGGLIGLLVVLWLFTFSW